MFNIIKNAINKAQHIITHIKKINLKDTSSSLSSCDVLFFCHDANRGITLSNRAYSPLIDSLRDDFERKGYKCITIAHPWSSIIGQEGYGDPVAINSAYFKATIIRKLLPKRFRLKPYELLFHKILVKTNPKLVITMNLHDALSKKARDLGIFHAELLHGIGYNPIPWNLDSKDIQYLPQCILSLDSVSTKTFSPLINKGVIVKEIPHPFLIRFKGKNIESLPQEWILNNDSKSYKKEILISLQWGYCYEIDKIEAFKDILSNGLFYDTLIKVIESTTDHIFWRFRLHPVQYRQPEKYAKLITFLKDFVAQHDNCEWLESTYLPLPSILERCSGHITMSSMVSYEAAYYGVPTLALSPVLRQPNSYYINMFNDLVESKFLLKMEASELNILTWVENCNKVPPALSKLSDVSSNNETISWLLSQTFT